MQDIWKLKKKKFGQGLFTLTEMAKQHGDFYIGSKRSKSDYLGVFRTVCCLANLVYSLFNGKRFRWCDGHVGTHSLPLILITSVIDGKLPAMYNCVKCVCICVIVSLMI